MNIPLVSMIGSNLQILFQLYPLSPRENSLQYVSKLLLLRFTIIVLASLLFLNASPKIGIQRKIRKNVATTYKEGTGQLA